MVRNRASSAEWRGSGMVPASGSPKTVEASSNDTMFSEIRFRFLRIPLELHSLIIRRSSLVPTHQLARCRPNVRGSPAAVHRLSTADGACHVRPRVPGCSHKTYVPRPFSAPALRSAVPTSGRACSPRCRRKMPSRPPDRVVVRSSVGPCGIEALEKPTPGALAEYRRP